MKENIKKNKKNKTNKTNDNLNKLINDYFVNKDIILSCSDDVSYRFIDVINKIDVTKFKFPEKEFDVVIAGGGLKGYYNFGACEILKKMIKNDQIKIRNYTGVSSGAYVALFSLLDISLQTIRNMYEFGRLNTYKHDLNKILSKICEHILPDNVHELLNGKLKILISKITLKGFKPVIIDNFKSKEHLIKVLNASSFIPLITTSEYRGIEIDNNKYFDGGFTNNTPVMIQHDFPQLLFNTTNVVYSSLYSYCIKDSNPELLIVRGAIDMEKLCLSFEKNDIQLKNIPLEWIPAKKDIRIRNNLFLNIFLNILLLISLIYGSLINLFNKNILDKLNK